MSSRKDTRKHRFYGALADPWRKLISVGLAALLWFWLNAWITRSHEEDVSLHFNDDTDGSFVWLELNTDQYGLKQFVNAETGDVLKRITIVLEGPNRLISVLEKPGQMAFRVRLSRSNVFEGNQRAPSITFGKDELHHRYDPSFTPLVKEMRPPSVRVELRKHVSIDLPLSEKNVDLQITGKDPSVALRLTNATFVPNPVEIYGAEEHLKGIGADTKLFVATEDSQKIDDSPNIIMSLTLAEEFRNLGLTLLTPPNVIYKIEPKRVTYLLHDVPVVLDTTLVGGDAGQKFEVEPKFVDIKILVAAQSALDSALNEHRQASMEISNVAPEWSIEHALFWVRLKKGDENSTAQITRQPSIQIFTLGPRDKRTTFDLDFLPADDLPFITIKRKQ
jgi:hypothetical protein